MLTYWNHAHWPKRDKPSLSRSLIAIVPLVGVAVLLQATLNRLSGNEHVFLLFIPSLLLAWYHGFKMALVCLAFSALGVVFVIYRPVTSLRLDSIDDYLEILMSYVLLAAMCWAVSTLAERTSDLRDALQTLQAVVSELADGVVFTDGQGENPRMNPAALTLLGFANQEQVFSALETFDRIFMLSDPFGHPIAPEDGPVHRILRGEVVRDLDVTVRRKDIVHTARISYSGSAVRDRDGKVKLVILLLRDSSKQAMVEAELRRAKNEAEKASLMKTSFLANMSHEIRTPMTAVLGFAEVLRNPGLSETDKLDALDRIDKSGRALLSLIDDILDISKIESGKMDFQPRRFSPGVLSSDVLSILSNQAERKGLELNLTVDREVPETFASDPARVRQILMNLVGNAVKFTEKGNVSVHIGFEENQLILKVSDTGVGLTAEEVSRLFRPFSQSDGSISRRFGGTGLGLFLSRQIAESMGGSLVLESSRKGSGSLFTARVPQSRTDACKAIKPAVASSAISSTGQHFNRLSVLVAEDVPDTRELLKIYLDHLGIGRAEFAPNGEEALNKASQQDYDLILMDVQMPGMDGVEATCRLRRRGYTRPIVALTAHAMPDEVETFLRQGFDGHIAKPFNKNDLSEALRRFGGSMRKAALPLMG